MLSERYAVGSNTEQFVHSTSLLYRNGPLGNITTILHKQTFLYISTKHFWNVYPSIGILFDAKTQMCVALFTICNSTFFKWTLLSSVCLF